MIQSYLIYILSISPQFSLSLGAIQKVGMQVGEGDVMTKVYGCIQGEEHSNLVSKYAFQLYIFQF